MTYKTLIASFTAGIMILAAIFYLFDGTPVHDTLFVDGNASSVSRIIDGDTIVMLNGDKVRLLGIDYPDIAKDRIVKWQEMGLTNQQINGCYAQGIHDLTQLLDNVTVTLEIDPGEVDKDQYGRLIRYAKLSSGVYIEEWLLERGFAIMYDPTKPQCAKCADFKIIEDRVRSQKVGCLWENIFPN